MRLRSCSRLLVGSLLFGNMTHPVPPPEPPPIIQTLQPEASHPDAQGVSANKLYSPILPKSLASKPSRFSAAKSAALLGPPISIGYHVERIDSTNLFKGSATDASASPPRSIQPLSASGVNTASVVIASETRSPTQQPVVEFNFQAPVVETQPATPPLPPSRNSSRWLSQHLHL